MHGEAGAGSRILPSRSGAVHGLVQVDNAASIRRCSWTYTIVDRISQRESWRRSVSCGRLLTCPRSSRTTWQSNITWALVVGGLNWNITSGVVAGDRAGVMVVG